METGNISEEEQKKIIEHNKKIFAKRAEAIGQLVIEYENMVCWYKTMLPTILTRNQKVHHAILIILETSTSYIPLFKIFPDLIESLYPEKEKLINDAKVIIKKFNKINEKRVDIVHKIAFANYGNQYVKEEEILKTTSLKNGRYISKKYHYSDIIHLIQDIKDLQNDFMRIMSTPFLEEIESSRNPHPKNSPR